MFGNDEIAKSSVKPVGELDLSRPLYVSKSRETVIEFALISGYDPRDPQVAITDKDRMISHSIPNETDKVTCARRLQKYIDKKTNTEKYGYDSQKFKHCELCDPMEESALKNNNIPTEYQRSIEVDFLARIFSYSSLVPKVDENGEIIKEKNKPVMERKDYKFEDGELAILRLSIGDAYFPTSKNGIAKDLKRLSDPKKADKKTGKLKTETSILVWSANQEDGITFDEVEQMSKEQMSELEVLRENYKNGEYTEMLEAHKPMSYEDWYFQEHGVEYENPLNRKSKKVFKKAEEVNVDLESEEAPY